MWIGASIYSVLELSSFILELIAYQFLTLESVRKITIAPQFTQDEEDVDEPDNDDGDQKKEDAF